MFKIVTLHIKGSVSRGTLNLSLGKVFAIPFKQRNMVQRQMIFVGGFLQYIFSRLVTDSVT